MPLAVKWVNTGVIGLHGGPVVHGDYVYFYPMPGGTSRTGAPLTTPTTTILKFNAATLTATTVDLSGLIPPAYPKMRFGSTIKVGNIAYAFPDRWPYVLRHNLTNDAVSLIPILQDSKEGLFPSSEMDVPYGFPQLVQGGKVIAGCRANPRSRLTYDQFGYDWTSSRFIVLDTTDDTAWSIAGSNASQRFVGSTHHAAQGKVYFMMDWQGSGYWSTKIDTLTMTASALTVPLRPTQSSGPRTLGHPCIGVDGNVYGARGGFVYRIDPDTDVVSWISAYSSTLAASEPGWLNTVVPTADGKVIFFPGARSSGSTNRWVHVYDIATNTVDAVEAYSFDHVISGLGGGVRGVAAANGQYWSLLTTSTPGASFLPNGGPISYYAWDLGVSGEGDQQEWPVGAAGRILQLSSQSPTQPAYINYIDVATILPTFGGTYRDGRLHVT